MRQVYFATVIIVAFSGLSSKAQETHSGGLPPALPGSGPVGALANEMITQQENLQAQQEIQSIENNFDQNIGQLSNNITQAEFQKSQCNVDYQQEIGEAEQDASQQKSQATGNMLNSTIGAVAQAMGDKTKKTQKSQRAGVQRQVDAYNEQVKMTFQEIPVLKGGRVGESQFLKTGISEGTPPFSLLTRSCSQASSDKERSECNNAVAGLSQTHQSLEQQITRLGVDDEAGNDLLQKIAQIGLPVGAGLFGMKMSNKNAEETLESRKQTAAVVRDACIQQADIQIDDMNRQLAALQKQKAQALETAGRAANLASLARKASALAEANAMTPSDPLEVQGLPIDPDSLLGDQNLAQGPTIGSPTVPFGANNSAANNPAAGSGSGAGAGAVAGGGGGGGSGGGGGGTNWTFGSPYPPFSGGGGLPQQPKKGKWKGGGGGGFAGGGFASAQDAFNSFDGGWGRNADGGTRRALGQGDGGLLTLLQRARLRLSAHSAELLTSDHTQILARKGAEEKKAPEESKIQRATASRLR